MHMQKATPLLLVLILAATAAFLSLRAKDTTPHTPPQSAESREIPASGNDVETTKTDTAVSKLAPEPWPQAASDIPADADATFGTLENGLRYIIYPNDEPPNRVSLRLHIDTGSLMESEDQRGLAHFLEHMVFNGSKNYSAADLIPRMQRLGISFGAHANAYTSFDETVYMLDLPDLSEETVDLGFTVMRDFGDGALLAKEEIDQERGVILSEKISRDSVNYRLMEQQFAALLPDSLITDRFPIGTEEVIQSAPRERFVDYYTRFYTPARMTFIVVGDVKPEEIESRIQDTFASMGNPADPGENPDLGEIRPPEGLETAVFSDREVSSTDVTLTLVRPHVEKPDTAANRAEQMRLDIANSMLSRRFERISKDKDSPVAEGSASESTLFNSVDLGSISITAADDRWQEVVPDHRAGVPPRHAVWLHRFRTRRSEVQPAQRLRAAGETKDHPHVRWHRHRARPLDQRRRGVFRSGNRSRYRPRGSGLHRRGRRPRGVQDFLGSARLPPRADHQGGAGKGETGSRRSF